MDSVVGNLRENALQLLKILSGNKKPSELQLRTTITGLKEGIDYVTSKDVTKNIADVERVLLVFGDYEKSHQFRYLVNKFLALTKPSGSVDPPWIILQLLFLLSNRPTEYYCEQSPLGEIPPEQGIDWVNLLRQPQLEPFSDSESLSDWSLIDDEEPSAVETDERLYTNREENLVFTETDPGINLPLEDVIRNQYWSDSVSRRTDYEVVREVIWALGNSGDESELFQKTAGKLKPCFGLHLSSFASLSLTEYLENFIPLIDSLRLIDTFLRDVKSPNIPLTFQAYAEAVHQTKGEFYSFLAGVEKEAEFLTLQTFADKLKNWKVIVCHLASTCHQIESRCPRNNCQKTLNLISHLAKKTEEFQITDKKELYSVYLTIFVSALKPYADMIDTWLTEGRLDDPRAEFFIRRNSTANSGRWMTWHDLLVVEDELTLVPFLRSVQTALTTAARSVELLTQLDEISCFSSKNRVQSRQLYQKLRNKFMQSSPGSTESSTSSRITDVENPLLAEAFSSIMESLEQPKILEKATVEPVLEQMPFAVVLEQTLLELVKEKETTACSMLLQVLKSKCRLEKHVENVRCVFFMQAGDVVQNFYTHLFSMMVSDDEWHNETTLTLSLQNCLANRLREDSKLFGFCKDPAAGNSKESFGQLSLNYSVSWPMTLILSEESLQLCNEVFFFLLRLKRSLWVLQRLSFKDMCSADELDRDSESLSGQLRLHRLQLLRSWLLHFIGSVDYYIMECVLESAHIQLDRQISSALHFGFLIEEHQRYLHLLHGRCFQHKSLAFLRDAVAKVLDISLDVGQIWSTQFTSMFLCQLEESYVQCHQFVASILASTAAHSILPDVGSLAAALIHSCPATDHTQNSRFNLY